MKKISFISILIIATQIVLAQKIVSRIDSISSREEVEKLIQSFKRLDKFTLIADSLGQPFYKTDFDSNNLTDLLALGVLPYYQDGPDGLKIKYNFHTFVVMNFGKDSLEIKSLNRSHVNYFTLSNIVNDTIVTFNYKGLIFKYGDFIEFNPHPKTYEIEKIEYKTTRCFGTCPVFRIEINKDKTAIFKAENYNSKTEISYFKLMEGKEDSNLIKGTFKTVINENSYSNIINLLNYIDFPNLKDNYTVNWTDDQSCTLKITYNNGKEKTINDYGLIGTYGLDRLYQLFFELRFNQNWK